MPLQAYILAMPIVTSSYRPKRAPRKKRTQPPLAQVIVTPAPFKRGPPKHVIRLRDQQASQEQPQRPVIVEPKPTRSIFGDVADMTPEEHQRRGDAAEALFRQIACRTFKRG